MTVGLAAIAAPRGAWAAPQFKGLYSFCKVLGEGPYCVDGTDVSGALTADSAGNVYGVTTFGGDPFSEGSGTIFEISTDGHRHTLHAFCSRGNCADGWEPAGPLTIDVNGNLYGTARIGGKTWNGVAFELAHNVDRTAWRLLKLYDFCRRKNCKDGFNPYGGLTYRGADTGAPYDGASPLYGITQNGGPAGGGGVIYELNSVPGTTRRAEQIVYQFCTKQGCQTGRPTVVTAASNGTLFGTTYGGGTAGKGTVFEISGGTQTVLHNFCAKPACLDGAGPGIRLIRDAVGTFYGTTAQGGLTGNGTVFRFEPGRGLKVLYNFCAQAACADGAVPVSVAIGANGALFGTAVSGGATDNGVIFRLHRTTERVIHSFCTSQNCADGSGPFGLIAGPSGRIFGLSSGGAYGGGVAWEMR